MYAVAQDCCHRKFRRMRRSMFGHVLRMPEDSPAQLSMQFEVAGSNRYRGRVGRHITNLFDVLRSDLKERASSYDRAETL